MSALTIVRRFLQASLSDDPEKWRLKTKAFHAAQHQFTKHRRFRAFDLHWRDMRDGFAEIQATLGESEALQVVATVYYGPWDTTDDSRLEGAVEVDPRYRRQGLATALYDWAEALTGLKFAPASSHTSDAEAFWRARRR